MFLHSEGTQRGSQSYMEKRRGRRELEVNWMRWGAIKRGESKLASNHFLMCAPQSGPLRNVHRITLRREEGGRKGTEVARNINRGIKRRETDPASNQFPKCSPPSRAHWWFTELGREEKGEGGDRSNLVEKKESPKGERAVKSVISHSSKNGYWRLGS